MGRKAEARKQRKLEALEKFDASKESFARKVVAEINPKMSPSARAAEVHPTLGHLVPIEILKEPRALTSRFAEPVTWCVRKFDGDGEWSWGEQRAWHDAEWSEDIEPKFKEFQQLTWKEVMNMGSDSGHSMHHHQELDTLAEEAQYRWMDLNLEEFDNLFRFRLGNKKRAWGIVVQAHFFMVWWEREHKIYPT
jgi:hypothetical protein